MKTDKKLKITRRDFLDGVALMGGAAALSPLYVFGEHSQDELSGGVYPPTLTGLRGNHPGSYDVAHALARGGQRPTQFEEVDYVYDLVVVGAGISGLTAAYLFRKGFGPEAKILLLDNHDDFGGHAKRNEFNTNGRTLLGVGGSLNLEQAAMGAAARSLLEEIGVDFISLRRSIEPDYMIHDVMSPHGLYLTASVYGTDRAMNGQWNLTWAGAGDFQSAIRSLQLPPSDEQGLINLISGEQDFLPGMSAQEREQFMHSTSYERFLSEHVGLSLEAVQITEPWIKALFGVSVASVSIYEALYSGAPGAAALLPPAPEAPDVDTANGEAEDPEAQDPEAQDPEAQDPEAQDPEAEESGAYRYPLYPDGNASVARLLVRHLIPRVTAGNTEENIVTSTFDYAQLDREGAPVRLRLNSTAVNVRNRDDGLTEASYVVAGKAQTVRAKHCILAGYGGMVPHLCPELPPAQKENLAYGVKVPFICTNVLLRSGASIRKAGVSGYQCPGSFYSLVATAPPVSQGKFQPPTQVDDPLVVWMIHAAAPPATGDQSSRDLYRSGRHQLLSMSFEDIEAATLSQLEGMFGATGFNAETDVEAITANRWAHGYAYEYMELHDPAWPEGEAPHELGRAPIGRISIANSDSEAHAYVQSAIDAAIRAVDEVLA
ncbi:NAD(P)-binding protein [Luminiphilus sp.]|nr:NAD(P)-binding protein [Luminiphilus sp.]MDA8985825.1 NAD(P)-binding protein [Luminiphilus sp.]MDB4049295.1 NAD(P)-binding protein [Luminiphilus sp.]